MKPQTETRRRIAASFAAFAIAIAPSALAQHGHDHSQHAPAAQSAPSAQSVLASGEGIVKKIDTEKQRLILAHDPIAKLNWPAMTMPFAVTAPDLLQGLKVGDRVGFDLRDEQTINALRRW